MDDKPTQEIVTDDNKESVIAIAEKSLLSALLLNEITPDKIIELEPQDFSENSRRKIVEAMKVLQSQSKPFSIHSVSNQLVSSGVMSESQALQTISSICDDDNATSTSDQYIEDLIADIKEFSDKRKAKVLLAKSLKDSNIASGVTTEQLIADTTSNLLEITTNRGQASGPFHINYVAKELDKHRNELTEAKKNSINGLTGIPTGFKKLNKITGGWQKKDLIILGALPSIGKTSLALTFSIKAMEHFAKNSKKAIIFYSVEMSNVMLVNRVLSQMSGVPFENIMRQTLNFEQEEKVDAALQTLNSYNFYLDETSGLSTSMIKAKTQKIASIEGGIGMIVVDYIGIMTAPQIRQNKVQEVSEISRTLKQLAKIHDCPVIALSQLRRGLDKEANPTPRLSDIKESGSIEQDADLVIFIKRTKETDKAEANKDDDSIKKEEAPMLLLRKHRNGETGNIKVGYTKNRMLYTDISSYFEEVPMVPE